MAKAKTLQKQKNSKRLLEFDPDENIKKLKPEDVLKTLMYCIEHNDYTAFREVATAYLETHNKVVIAKKMGVSRRALYHMLGQDANPTIQNVMNFYQAIKMAS